MTEPTSPETPDLTDLEGDAATGAPDSELELDEVRPPEPGPSPQDVEATLGTDAVDDAEDRLQEEYDALNDRHLRLAAEFTNYRRRSESERAGTWDRAQADLVRAFLDVLDDLQRVALLDPEDEAVTVQSIVEGIDLVERKFLRALQDAGAEILSPASGSPFDPESMEAMMRVPVEDEALDDTVSDVFAKGYLFRGHLVRPARVTVNKVD
ncbi:MAG: nucleotide exchange factor GrpE [Gemmatimonadetes bacterium]|nr:nucleotide exchange factor GrpE [Gemmatimonadota bacterium]